MSVDFYSDAYKRKNNIKGDLTKDDLMGIIASMHPAIAANVGTIPSIFSELTVVEGIAALYKCLANHKKGLIEVDLKSIFGTDRNYTIAETANYLRNTLRKVAMVGQYQATLEDIFTPSDEVSSAIRDFRKLQTNLLAPTTQTVTDIPPLEHPSVS